MDAFKPGVGSENVVVLFLETSSDYGYAPCCCQYPRTTGLLEQLLDMIATVMILTRSGMCRLSGIKILKSVIHMRFNAIG